MLNLVKKKEDILKCLFYFYHKNQKKKKDLGKIFVLKQNTCEIQQKERKS